MPLPLQSMPLPALLCLLRLTITKRGRVTRVDLEGEKYENGDLYSALRKQVRGVTGARFLISTIQIFLAQ